MWNLPEHTGSLSSDAPAHLRTGLLKQRGDHMQRQMSLGNEVVKSSLGCMWLDNILENWTVSIFLEATDRIDSLKLWVLVSRACWIRQVRVLSLEEQQSKSQTDHCSSPTSLLTSCKTLAWSLNSSVLDFFRRRWDPKNSPIGVQYCLWSPRHNTGPT